MISTEALKQLALNFPKTVEQSHFQKTSIRVGKKIFVTIDFEKRQACVKLSEEDQSVFASFNKLVIYPVANSWGKQGWTMIDLDNAPKPLIEDAVTTAYCYVAPTKLSLLVRQRRVL